MLGRPAARAIGLIRVFSSCAGQNGRLPLVYGEAKNQSSGLLYGVEECHWRSSSSKSSGNGKLVREASVLSGVTRP